MGSDRYDSNAESAASKSSVLPAIMMASTWVMINLLFAWLMGWELALTFFFIVLFLLTVTALLVAPALLVLSEIRPAEDLRRWRTLLIIIWVTSLLLALLLTLMLQSGWLSNE
jgi:small-conductance mechanosensitive channel